MIIKFTINFNNYSRDLVEEMRSEYIKLFKYFKIMSFNVDF